ncbi:hypothetical protein DVH24_036162 [Malus domestica]|uniref:non-specific serine/threonine protein kinase n=1 Tax=Malus domestica TaxID=3750 RepID=A0A498IJZ8_MALDO|nr:hypothetical protein DVH24_036162 [Malus domestica]
MMEHSCTVRNLVLLKFLHGFILLVLCMMSTCPESVAFPSPTLLGNESDRLALLDFKKRITEDPLSVMSSWNHSIHFCSWVGIACHRATQRVLILDLEDKQLVGSIPPSIGNLTRLIEISLGINKFHGEIPQELGRLRTLESLNLSFNSLGGKIPTNMSHCTQLRVFDLISNKIIGSIPHQLSSRLSLLAVLHLKTNNLSGTIPGWIGNFTSLRSLRLGRNNFQGSIPNELGHITTLKIFSVGDNNLSGNIPVSLPNASRLQVIDFASNDLTGAIPGESLGSLRSLNYLNFGDNRLGNGKLGEMTFLNFLTNCTSLQSLVLAYNHFGGEIPRSIANLSTQLQILYLGANLLHGNLPNGIGNLINLIDLDVGLNNLAGVVPEEIGKLEKIGILYLNDNKLSGPIPSSFGNMTSLIELRMERNSFEGSIPPSLGNCQNLLLLSLYKNNLTGSIPKKLMELSTISITLELSDNHLTGSLPSEVGGLVHLTQLDVSNNKLSGDIPSTLGSCASLERLYLNDNKFEGTLPQSLKDLKGLEELDISSNNLSGQIPEFIGKLGALKYLNLSCNDFEGELPKKGFFSNVSDVSVLGNHRLCGGIPQLHLPTCPINKHHSSSGLLSLKVVIPISCALAFIIALSCFFGAQYGMGCQVSILGDVYSYGVILLEMFTGKTPTDDMFIEGLSIYKFAAMALPNHVMDVVDLSLLLDLEADGSVNDDRYERTALPKRNNREVVKAKKVEECLFAVMQIGLSCCAVSPRERMLLNMVVGKMSAIRDSYLKEN